MILFLLAAVAGVALGLLQGGTLSQLQHTQLRLAWLALPATAAQVAIIVAPPAALGAGSDPLRWCLPATVILLALFIASNHARPGMRIIFAGLALNFAVIIANGGLMPTNETSVVQAGLAADPARAHELIGHRLPRSKDVVLPVEQTQLWILSDTLVSPPLPRRKVMSVGDLVIALGLLTALSGAMRRRLPSLLPSRLAGASSDEMNLPVLAVRQTRPARLRPLRGSELAAGHSFAAQIGAT